MARVFVGVGSNVDRDTNVRAGIAALGGQFGRLRLSPVYESPAVGFDGNAFYNLVAEFETSLAPLELDRLLHEIEERQGRKRNARSFAPRTLDLDLLLYDDLVTDSGALRIPRDDIDRYAFVLCPLADLAGDLPHPATGVPFRDLWARFDGGRDELRPVEFDWNPGSRDQRRKA